MPDALIKPNRRHCPACTSTKLRGNDDNYKCLRCGYKHRRRA